MDYVTRRLGRDVSLADIMRINGNDIMPLASVYGFKLQSMINALKTQRALQLLECMQSQPDKVFELPTWEKNIPLGTVFVAGNFNPIVDADHVFFRVTKKVEKECCKELCLVGVRTDFTMRRRVLPQTDHDILAGQAYEEYEARPSDIPCLMVVDGPTYFIDGRPLSHRPVVVRWRVNLEPDASRGGVSWSWRSLRAGEKEAPWNSEFLRITNPEVYIPGPVGPPYIVRRRYTVYKSVVHPWLRYHTMLRMARSLKADDRYSPQQHLVAAQTLHLLFQTDKDAHTVNCPPVKGSSQGLVKVLSVVQNFTDALPPSARRALMQTSTELRDLLTPLDQEREQILRKVSGIFRAASFKSPRQLFSVHFENMVASAKQEFAKEPHRIALRFHMMPYWTPYRFVLMIGFPATYVTLCIVYKDEEELPLLLKQASPETPYVLSRYRLATSTKPAKIHSRNYTIMPIFLKAYLSIATTIFERQFSHFPQELNLVI